MTGLFGGTFNPPHYGHIALAARLREHFGFDRLRGARIGCGPVTSRSSSTPATRLQFDRGRVSRTTRSCSIRTSGRSTCSQKACWSDPFFLIGADQFAEFLTWKDPEGVLERARVGVATRPGYGREVLEPVLRQL